MNEIDELQRRIAAAMDRVARGVEAMGQAAPEPAPAAEAPAGRDEDMAEAPPAEPAVQRKRRVIADEDEDEDM